MKVNIVKDHPFHEVGEAEIEDQERANYLIRVGVAEEVKDSKQKETKPKTVKKQDNAEIHT